MLNGKIKTVMYLAVVFFVLATALTGIVGSVPAIREGNTIMEAILNRRLKTVVRLCTEAEKTYRDYASCPGRDATSKLACGDFLMTLRNIKRAAEGQPGSEDIHE